VFRGFPSFFFDLIDLSEQTGLWAVAAALEELPVGCRPCYDAASTLADP
jgi:hypothetical protein